MGTVGRLPQNLGEGRGVRVSFFRKLQNDQEKQGSEAIASLMRHPEFDTHTKLHRKGTCRDFYTTLAVLVQLCLLPKPGIFRFKGAETNFPGKTGQWDQRGVCLKIQAWGGKEVKCVLGESV